MLKFEKKGARNLKKDRNIISPTFRNKNVNERKIV